ncbi:hypothetical protein F2Q70_00000612 [Brassica cretica]|uniref:F-box associated beta-propeller type 3 domain-containing protein n=1 Tax=Brassica cretica TaxID=69181 RepID=A0A8S9IX21_BRACR|nr:hypothetical protein F2Q70_00000612 [Brassica cretica]
MLSPSSSSAESLLEPDLTFPGMGGYRMPHYFLRGQPPSIGCSYWNPEVFGKRSEEIRVIQAPHAMCQFCKSFGFIEHGGKPAIFDYTRIRETGVLELWVLEVDGGIWSRKSLVLKPCQRHLVDEINVNELIVHGTAQNNEVILALTYPCYLLYYDLIKNDLRKVEPAKTAAASKPQSIVDSYTASLENMTAHGALDVTDLVSSIDLDSTWVCAFSPGRRFWRRDGSGQAEVEFEFLQIGQEQDDNYSNLMVNYFDIKVLTAFMGDILMFICLIMILVSLMSFLLLSVK